MSSSGGTESLLVIDGILYRSHEFTSNGTLTVNVASQCEILVVGGGGAGTNMSNNQVTVNVAAGWGADGRQIGKDIEEYLRQYATVSGGSFANGSIGNLFGR